MQLLDQESSLLSEKAVIESVLLDNTLFFAATSLQPDDFQTDYHRQMWRVIAEKITNSENVDLVSLYGHFSKIKSNGLSSYLMSFDSGVVTASASIETRVQEVANTSQRRKINAVLEAAMRQSADLSEDNASVISVTYDRLNALQEKSLESKTFAVSDFSGEYCQRIEKIADNERVLGGFTTGLEELDRLTSGIRTKEYVIVGAYPGEGKTAFALQLIAANCEAGAKVGLFSQEMSKEAILQRLLVQVSDGRLESKKLRNPRSMTAADRFLLRESQRKIDRWNLWVNDSSTFRASELVAHAHMMGQRYGVNLFVVDYLQLLKADGEKRYEQVSNASAALREFAKNRDAAVVGISQLSRPEGKIKRRPTIFDLRESGQLEQDSHLVLFPYRPLTKSGSHSGDDEIVIGKQREGPVGIVPVVFDKKRLSFVPREASYGESEEWQ